MPITPLKDWCSHYAIFWNDAGVHVGTKKIKYKEPVFDYDNRKFNFFPDNSSFFKVKGFFKSKKYYQYNINNPNPLYIKTSIEPLIDSRTHKAIYDNKLVQQLCDLADNWFMQFLKKYWWLILAIIVLVGFFASGGDISSLTSSSPSPEPVISNITLVRPGGIR